jgi:hypothetical protein
MKEFNIIQMGAGKHFLRALQGLIAGEQKEIKINNNKNLYDIDYYGVNDINNTLRQFKYMNIGSDNQIHNAQWLCEEELRNKRKDFNKTKELISECLAGVFNLNMSLPSINNYGIVCVLDSPQQYLWCDNLSKIKKDIPLATNLKNDLARNTLIYDWEIKNNNNYKYEFKFNYSDIFFKLNTTTISNFIKYTEDKFNVSSSVTTKQLLPIIDEYTRINKELLNE